ncbi:MAG: phage portal protein [Promethearchaeota archaeon]
MLNTLDKIKSYFSPVAAYEISKLRNASALYGGLYDGATQSPHYNIQNFETTEDEDIADLQTLRATSRDKYKNNGFYKGIIQAATDHAIGGGLKAKSTIQRKQIPNLTEERAKEIESMLDRYFNSWAESTICDITAKDNFFSIQRLAYKIYKKDGDSFASLPLSKIGNFKAIQINLIGAENITSNKAEFIEGIKTSKNKMPLEYSILQADNTYNTIRAFSKGKRNMLHIFERERAKQIRGIPFLTPVMRDIDAIDQYMKYELTAAKLAAIFFGSITTESKTDVFGNKTDLLTGEETQTTKNTVKENSITQLATGDKLNIHQQGRDNPNYDKFILTSLQKVSADTRIPLEVILTIFASSYSASRASMLLMEKFVKPERMLFINSFCKPTRDQVITWGILQGDLVIPDFFENKSAYLKAIWIGDPMGSVDPVKDVKAHILAIDNYLGTREKSTSDLGHGDFETNVDILTKEKELIKDLIPKEEIDTNDSN